MRRAFLVSTLVLAAARLAGAQNAPKAARIGWVTAQRAASLAPNIGALQSALADLGYVEGRNLTIEFRYGDDAVERVPELAVLKTLGFSDGSVLGFVLAEAVAL